MVGEGPEKRFAQGNGYPGIQYAVLPDKIRMRMRKVMS